VNRTHIRWIVRIWLGLMVIAAGGLSTAHAVSAQDAGGTITVNVFNQTTDDKGAPTKVAVAAVTITVADASGATVTSGATDAKGRVVLKVPAQTKYTIALATASLPKGITLASGQSDKATVDFAAGAAIGGNKTFTYFLGKDTRKTTGRFELLLQTIVNGLKTSSILAICCIGLSLIYGTTGLSNFAHGELITIGAIVTWLVNQKGPRLHLLLAAPFGIVAAALGAMALERGVWRPLRRRGTSLTSMMIMSIGIAIAVRYIYIFVDNSQFNRSQFYRQYHAQPQWNLGPIGITERDFLIICLSLVVILGVIYLLLKTRQGKAIRAVSDNPDLASATGINTNKIILMVWALGGALAGLGGIMFGASPNGLQWDTGFNLLLLLFAAITVGGLGNPFGALVGALIIGMATELWTWLFPSLVEFKNGAALGALIITLIIRPQGILGRKERLG
jgi:neutral amino acid transport system permease protein